MTDMSRETPTAFAPEAHAIEPVGRLLKQERLRQNKTLKEVAEATCIHINTLEALEEDHVAKLPAEVFVRGFISIYAQHLGLDPQEALNQYGRKTTAEWVSPGTELGKDKARPAAASRSAASGRRRLVLFFGLAVAALLGAWGYQQSGPPHTDRLLTPAPKEQATITAGQSASESRSRSEEAAEETRVEEETAAPVVQDEQSAAHYIPAGTTGPKESASRSAPEPMASPVAASPAAETAPATPEDEPAVASTHDSAYVLEAQFTESTWLRISLDGQDSEEYLFQPGERHTWKADSIELFLGNAGGVALVLNGEPQPSPGPSGKTARLRFAAGNT